MTSSNNNHGGHDNNHGGNHGGHDNGHDGNHGGHDNGHGHGGHDNGHGHGGNDHGHGHDHGHGGHGHDHGHGGHGHGHDHGHGHGHDHGGGCVPCFATGTMILTAAGEMAVQDLAPGMLVMTRDRGLQPLRWTGSRVVDAAELAANPNLRPVRISAGALGNGLPSRDLIVSPQHRVLVRSRIAQKMFGAAEVLVAAKQLLQIEGIDIATDVEAVEYFHFLFDRHEIVISEGAETESLYTGAEALKAVGPAAQDEIFAIFPELRDMAEDHAPEGARILASGRQGRKLAVRHAQHQKALVQ